MPRRPWIGIHPSQYSTTWRNVTGPPAPPIRIGGCGVATGFGQLHDGEKLTNSPSNDASSCVHSSRIASTFSRVTARRRFGSTPWCSISSSFQPTPMPSDTRPSDSEVERGDRLGLDDRVVLGDERDAGAEAQPLRHRRRGGEGDERVERAAVLLGQLRAAGPRRAPARRDVGVLGDPQRLEAAVLQLASPGGRAGSRGRSGRSARRCASAATVRRPSPTAPDARTSRRRLPCGASTGCPAVPGRPLLTRPPDGGRARWRVKARGALSAHPWSVNRNGSGGWRPSRGWSAVQSGGDRSVCSANLMLSVPPRKIAPRFVRQVPEDLSASMIPRPRGGVKGRQSAASAGRARRRPRRGSASAAACPGTFSAGTGSSALGDRRPALDARCRGSPGAG